MKNADTFSGFHPVNNLLYFLVILAVSMFSMNPLYLGISFLGAYLYYMRLSGPGKAGKRLLLMLPVMLFTALLNPLFNHQGMTILTYFGNGNPLTLEAILYGAYAAVMLAAVVFWFFCFSEVLPSEKFIYLFGRIIPSLSLLISMTIRFVPLFVMKMKEVWNAQKCLGKEEGKKLPEKMHFGIRVFSVLITWAMENAIETADSMRSRGYGLPGRTSFSIYRFERRDRPMLLWILAAGAIVFTGWSRGALYWRFYPTVKWAGFRPETVSVAAVFLIFSLTPLFTDLYEDLIWRRQHAFTS